MPQRHGEHSAMPSSNVQSLNPKQIPNPKADQFRNWNLEIGDCLEFRTWNLEFLSISVPLCLCGQYRFVSARGSKGEE